MIHYGQIGQVEESVAVMPCGDTKGFVRPLSHQMTLNLRVKLENSKIYLAVQAKLALEMNTIEGMSELGGGGWGGVDGGGAGTLSYVTH